MTDEESSSPVPPMLPGKKVTPETDAEGSSSRVYRPDRVFEARPTVFKPKRGDSSTLEGEGPAVSKDSITVDSYNTDPPPTPNALNADIPDQSKDFYWDNEAPRTSNPQKDFEAPNLTGYRSEYSRTSKKTPAERGKPVRGKIALFTTLSLLALSVIFSWTEPAGLDWFFGLIVLPVGVSLSISSFLNKEKIGLGILALMLSLTGPAIPVLMYITGFMVTVFS